MYYKIASILLNNEQKAGTASDIFIAQPDNQKEALVGKLFVSAEITSESAAAAKILTFLIGNLNFNYYQSEKVILKERIETISIESIFESALAKSNKDLADFISQEKIKISPYAFNVTVCVLYKNEIYFASIGKNKSLLIYKEKTAIKTKGDQDQELEKIEYKISDVGETSEGEALNINKLFSNVITGKIPVGGYFLVINEALSEYLSNKQLIRIITKLSPSGAAEQIRNLLEQINSYVSFLGIIIKNTVASSLTGEELKNQLEEEIKVDDYKPEITRTEEKTEDIMTPAGIVNLKKWSKSISEKIKPAIQPAKPSSPHTKRGIFLLKEKIFFKKRNGLFSLEKIKFVFSKIIKLVGAVFGFIVKIFSRNKDFDTGLPVETPSITVEKKPTIISGNMIKVILVIAIICIAGFFINLSITNKRNLDQAKLKDFNALISSIEKNQNKIDAAFVYGNTAEVKQLYNLNTDLLAQIPQAEVAKRESIKALFSKQQQQLEKVKNINRVSGLAKIGDFSNLTSQADPQNIILNNGIIYAGDSKNNAIFKIDTKQNIVTALYNIASSSNLSHPSKGQVDNTYYLSNGNIIELDKEGKTNQLTIPLPSSSDNVTGIESYSDKYYVMDKNLGQIFRYTRATDSFTNKTKWLSSTADLSLSSGMFIDQDGNLYILYKNGQVEKYLKGKKLELTMETVDPAITSASRIIVTTDNIFVLEAGNGRLNVFNNKGDYMAQFLFSDLTNIKDFEINVTDKKIYLLSGAAVYQMDIPQHK